MATLTPIWPIRYTVLAERELEWCDDSGVVFATDAFLFLCHAESEQAANDCADILGCWKLAELGELRG